jgi:hypothetical protein
LEILVADARIPAYESVEAATGNPPPAPIHVFPRGSRIRVLGCREANKEVVLRVRVPEGGEGFIQPGAGHWDIPRDTAFC